jgi:hypothetical protein
VGYGEIQTLTDNPFDLVTDHKALTSFREISGKSAKLERWSLKLQDYKFNIQHRAGTKMPADFLSRHVIATIYIQKEKEIPIDGTRVSTVVSMSKFVKYQEEDKDFRIVFNKLKGLKEKLNINAQEVELGSGKYASYVLKPDMRLYHRMHGSRLEKKKSLVDRLCIPQKCRKIVLQEYHDRSHFSEKKTYADMQKRVFWPGMHRDVEVFCRSCDICQRRNAYTQRTEGPLQGIESSRRFELIHLDLFSGVPESNKKNKYCLVMTDAVTKFTVAVPLKNKEQNTVARKFLKHWVKYFGFPERMQTDGGLEFAGVMNALCELMKIRKHTTTPYHPQANGEAEIRNKVIIDMISKHVSDTQKLWDEMLPMVMLEYNVSVHTTTKECPYFLVFGREPRTPMEMFFKIDLNEKQKESSNWKKELIIDLFTKLGDTRVRISEQQKKSRDRILERISKRVFLKGDEVMVRVKPRTEKSKESHKKLKLKWEGPYVILDTPTEIPNCYTVQKKGTEDNLLVNRKNVKRYFTRPDWMSGIDNLEADEEHMEEIDHMNPPVTEGEDLEKNLDRSTQEIPAELANKGETTESEEPPAESAKKAEQTGPSPRHWRWKKGDKCDALIGDKSYCSKIIAVQRGLRGTLSRATVLYKEPIGKRKKGTHTFNRLRPCEHGQDVWVVGMQPRSDSGCGQHLSGWDEHADKPIGQANKGEGWATSIADERDILIVQMQGLLKDYLARKV